MEASGEWEEVNGSSGEAGESRWTEVLSGVFPLFEILWQHVPRARARRLEKPGNSRGGG